MITLHAEALVHLAGSLRDTVTETFSLDGTYSPPRIGLAAGSRNIVDWSIITELPYLIRQVKTSASTVNQDFNCAD